MPNLDFEKEEVGLETVKDLPAQGRCSTRSRASSAAAARRTARRTRTGKLLNPKTLILQNEEALLAGKLDAKLVDLYDENVLWQCTTCGACENQCPVGIEHLPLIIGARRGLVSNGEAAEYLGGVYNNLERRGNIWGLLLRPARRSSSSRPGVEIFDPREARVPRVARLRRRVRGRLPEVAARAVRHPAREGRDLRRAGEGAVHGRRRQADAATSTCSRSWRRRTSRTSRPPA